MRRGAGISTGVVVYRHYNTPVLVQEVLTPCLDLDTELASGNLQDSPVGPDSQFLHG